MRGGGIRIEEMKANLLGKLISEMASQMVTGVSNHVPSVFTNQFDKTAPAEADLVPSALIFDDFNQVLGILIADRQYHPAADGKL